MMLKAWYHFYKLIFVKILWILSIEHQKMLSNHHLACGIAKHIHVSLLTLPFLILEEPSLQSFQVKLCATGIFLIFKTLF